MRYFVMIMMFWVGYLPAQRVITGKVVERYSRESVFGASVAVKGTEYSVMSDFDGSFEIDFPEDADSLVISMIGYQTKVVHVPISQKSDLLIDLEDALPPPTTTIHYTRSSNHRIMHVGFDFVNGAVGGEWNHLFRLWKTHHEYDVKLYKGNRNQYLEVGYEYPYVLSRNSKMLLAPHFLYRDLRLKEVTTKQYDAGIKWSYLFSSISASMLGDSNGKGWELGASQWISGVDCGVFGSLGKLNGQWQYSAKIYCQLFDSGIVGKVEYRTIGDYQGAFIKLSKSL